MTEWLSREGIVLGVAAGRVVVRGLGSANGWLALSLVELGSIRRPTEMFGGGAAAPKIDTAATTRSVYSLRPYGKEGPHGIRLRAEKTCIC